eukprot:CAMPEP_0180215220 /NCGR_PEP_ID=MMETSP0987-20121128/15377_1 /TAXON_ID=697907 /ORGANISM="non described non described, Strain CCMP2293" /LENGTH=106 /DNA_ID=CAMNT_0022173859 /DNA_START=121 /DNA_END=444 /DNA_ORIENTATION=+
MVKPDLMVKTLLGSAATPGCHAAATRGVSRRCSFLRRFAWRFDTPPVRVFSSSIGVRYARDAARRATPRSHAAWCATCTAGTSSPSAPPSTGVRSAGTGSSAPTST